ncbi:hypothetical protein RJT34_20039 [Clitoria ternatea]|uniref:Uncharacterized protein n=1 Tax=Clitoria ternatea TaxID=43366 RepID=A0AAN9P5B7_CLITE
MALQAPSLPRGNIERTCINGNISLTKFDGRIFVSLSNYTSPLVTHWIVYKFEFFMSAGELDHSYLMASRIQIPTNNSALIAMIADEDTVVGFLLAGVANMIRFLVDSYNKLVPAILEIPSKDHPYDPAHESVLSRVKY